MLTEGPKTEGGFLDLMMFGNCVEKQLDDGTWVHVPIEEWLDTQPADDPYAKPLADHVRSIRSLKP